MGMLQSRVRRVKEWLERRGSGDATAKADPVVLVGDVRSGMTASELMDKHGLSVQELRQLYGQLLNGVEEYEPAPDEPLVLSGNAAGHDSRREFPRHYLAFLVPVWIADHPENRGWAIDLTEKGLGVRGLRIERGERKRLAVKPRKLAGVEQIEFQGRCQWSETQVDGDCVCGFQIVDISPSNLQNLREFIKFITVGDVETHDVEPEPEHKTEPFELDEPDGAHEPKTPPAPARHVIKGKDIVGDIRSGMTDLQLMRKYRLTTAGLRRVLRGLLDGKAITQAEHDWRPVGDNGPGKSPGTVNNQTSSSEQPPSRPKIDARKALDDILDGMDDASLMAKYELSVKGLYSLFSKLLDLGALTRADLVARTSVALTAEVKLYKCASCGTIEFDDPGECPECGADLRGLT